MSKECLIVFTRYPEPGKAKTRLIPALGTQGAANLHRQLTEYTLSRVRELQGERPTSVEVYFSGGNQQLMQDWLGADFVCKPQVDGDLGLRIVSAFDGAFSNGIEGALIIGTDCPDLSAKIMSEAFDGLILHDLVLGPALDGGYYLIGLRRVFPQLFAEIPWGTSEVLAKTIAIASSMNLSIAYLPPLADIDRPEDLAQLKNFEL